MKKGSVVAVLDDDIYGVVSTIVGDDVTIVTDDGFEMQYLKNELVIQETPISDKDLFSENMSKIIFEKESTKKKKPGKIKQKERSLPPMVVDLHIHQLVSNQKGLNNYEMLTIQLDEAKRQLEFAIRKRVQKIVFIHGVGEGVLKLELEFLFKRYDHLKFYDADYQKYGVGATEVYIFQNKTR